MFSATAAQRARRHLQPHCPQIAQSTSLLRCHIKPHLTHTTPQTYAQRFMTIFGCAYYCNEPFDTLYGPIAGTTINELAERFTIQPLMRLVFVRWTLRFGLNWICVCQFSEKCDHCLSKSKSNPFTASARPPRHVRNSKLRKDKETKCIVEISARFWAAPQQQLLRGEVGRCLCRPALPE